MGESSLVKFSESILALIDNLNARLEKVEAQIGEVADLTEEWRARYDPFNPEDSIE